jgi:hypothetical protein
MTLPKTFRIETPSGKIDVPIREVLPKKDPKTGRILKWTFYADDDDENTFDVIPKSVPCGRDPDDVPVGIRYYPLRDVNDPQVLNDPVIRNPKTGKYRKDHIKFIESVNSFCLEQGCTIRFSDGSRLTGEYPRDRERTLLDKLLIEGGANIETLLPYIEKVAKVQDSAAKGGRQKSEKYRELIPDAEKMVSEYRDKNPSVSLTAARERVAPLLDVSFSWMVKHKIGSKKK